MLFLLFLWSTWYVNASETPIVGVLSQEAYLVAKAYPEAHSFVVASYIKLLEGSGARVVPVWCLDSKVAGWTGNQQHFLGVTNIYETPSICRYLDSFDVRRIGQDEEYYKRVMNFTNGMLLPGGGTYFNESGGYGEAARQIYGLAVKANEDGVHYPLFGICLGMQALIYGASGMDIRKNCQAKNVSLPLDFAPGFEKSKLLSKAPLQLLENLRTKNLTYNYHRYCIFEMDLMKNKLLDEWRIISTNRDLQGLEFISSIEHLKYPFFGVQFHPEKNPFEFSKSQDIPHSPEAIEVTQYLGNFFVNECRKNDNSFPTIEMEEDALIYNYDTVHSFHKTSYRQIYLFHPNHYDKKLL